MHRFQYSESNNITVKGLGATDFKSDLIVWEGSFNAENKTLNDAYAQLSADRDVVKSFLKNKGVSDNETIFGAVSTYPRLFKRFSSIFCRLFRFEDYKRSISTPNGPFDFYLELYQLSVASLVL